ncbi:hypothetical protein [Rhodoblastus sp.]|uniref:terminase small subunit-like protein n=1 Tax=Rhodoblastus sp. TaxID=1962975 RepID=UPI00261CF827|nr:hypothetical protein [Rhodoblastus sp.]
MPRKRETSLIPPWARPPEYTEEAGELYCHMIASGVSPAEIAKTPGMPNLLQAEIWRERHAGFGRMLDKAYTALGLLRAHEVVPLADCRGSDAAVAIDARRWFSGKTAPRYFGDKFQIEARLEANAKIDVVVQGPRIEDAFADSLSLDELLLFEQRLQEAAKTIEGEIVDQPKALRKG